MKFNEKIKTALKNKEITQYRLAKDLGINQGQLSRFLKHNDQLSTRNLQKIFDYLKISI
jgi:transcriptional regulator with XRE-family HTH domain